MSSKEESQSADIAVTVVAKMRKLGIAPLPRNYELVYEALNTSPSPLSSEYDGLGSAPTQEQLDELGKKFFPLRYGRGAVDSAHERMSDELEDMLELLKRERSSMESYSSILSETHDRISSRSAVSTQILSSAINVLSEATGKSMEEGKEAVRHVMDSAREMAKIKDEIQEYKRLADADALTGLLNRRAFDTMLSTIYGDRRKAMYSALVIADIDYFKRLNDTYGHQVGDHILKVVALVLKNLLDKDTFVARIGGEEFAMLLTDTSLAQVKKKAEQIRRAVEATPFENKKTKVNYGPVTMSFGICMATNARRGEEIYNKADAALYTAKYSGRNLVEVYDPALNAELEKRWARLSG